VLWTEDEVALADDVDVAKLLVTEALDGMELPVTETLELPVREIELPDVELTLPVTEALELNPEVDPVEVDPVAEAELLDPMPVNPLVLQPAVGIGRVKVVGIQARYC
jgi:hypothetical protein